MTFFQFERHKISYDFNQDCYVKIFSSDSLYCSSNILFAHRLIVDKIDSDTDGLVSQEELKDWIRFTQRRYITDDVDRQWKTHNPEDKEKISWDEYKKMLYGFMDGEFLLYL